MSWRNRVVWSEGLFLRPQHFQQQTRYIESLVESRCERLRPSSWGFTHLRIDQEQLDIGKLSISEARGVFPDGTPFNIPDDDPPPPPIDVTDDVRDVVVYLGLPARSPGTQEIDIAGNEDGLMRFQPTELEVRDAAQREPNPAPVQVGKLRLRLLLDSEPRSEYACMGAGHIVEARSDKKVLLDDRFIPPVLDCRVSPVLSGFISILQGMLHQKGVSLANISSGAGRSGAADIADFLRLQIFNRYEPLITHFSTLGGLHPEELFRVLIQLAGELATFSDSRVPSRRPTKFPEYHHDNLRVCFDAVFADLREAINADVERRAEPIPLKARRFGMHKAVVADQTLFDSAQFILAVAADMPAEDLRQRFPALVKIGPPEQIRDIVTQQLPGVQLQPCPTAPRAIPYHAGNVYFELDRGSQYWDHLKTSGGVVLHVGGEFPNLQMEFWAIRR
ncbi:MAG: type VI secretion system baseplate subunit TssK [Gammaproteobacteria bacterium]|nr:type VI secretion system baseplate subunit TssK [Gammaproteobacteria bacterium]